MSSACPGQSKASARRRGVPKAELTRGMPLTDYRVGSDVGGTFTDMVVASPSGRLTIRKVPSSPDNYASAIGRAMEEMASSNDVVLDRVAEFLHGTTVATNAILERKGARVALITTRGFRDVLEIGRLRMPVLYDIDYVKPPSIVPRHMRLEVDERVDASGAIHAPLDMPGAEAVIRRAVELGAEAIAVCLLNAHASPIHENALRVLADVLAPGVFVCFSTDINPEIGEYERTSTTAINAYLGPVISRYVQTLEETLRSQAIEAPLRIAQSSGGTIPGSVATRKPACIVESGPAAGAVAARALGRRIGRSELIAFDMGGTTAKASVIEGGELTWVNEFQVGGPISSGARVMRAGGYVIRFPSIDVAEVGAGGGSIVRVDSGGALQVGPSSAGSDPGPVAYDNGGELPTVTDANVVLGYMNPSAIAGGAVRLDRSKAERALTSLISEPLGASVEDAALAIYQVANSNMIRAINAVTVERGRDPRDFSLLAFGGSGPIHAASIAKQLRVREVIVPPAAGLFSAIGLLGARPEFRASLSCRVTLRDASHARLESDFQQLEDAVRVEARQARYSQPLRMARYVDVRYRGQAYSLTVPAPAEMQGESVADIVRTFEAEYARAYGHLSPDEVHEATSLRVVGVGAEPPALGALVTPPAPPTARTRAAYFGQSHGWVQVPTVARSALSSSPRRGPLIIDEYDTTIVVPPGNRALLDHDNNVVIQIEDAD